MQTLLLTLSITALLALTSPAQPAAGDQEKVLPGRHLSEHQAVDIADKELHSQLPLQCDFQDGVWQISQVDAHTWGVSSAITNSDGKITITSTNALKLVLRVRDADGKTEPVKP